MPSAVVNGAKLNYVQVDPEDSSCVQDLVMVHGLATNMAFWYFQYAQRFARRFRVTVFDLRGHGRSQMTERGYTPEALTADLAGLLDHLGIERAHFMAHSFGGVVTLGLARNEPRRVKSLVIADSHLSSLRGESHHTWEHGAEIQAIVDRHGLDLDVRDPYFGYRLLNEVARLLLREPELPKEVESLLGPVLGKHGTRTARQWLRLITTTQAERELVQDDGLTDDLLFRLCVPTLVMYGQQSKARPSGQHLTRVWPHAEFHEVEGAGHFFPSTRPQEVIARCEDFWQRAVNSPAQRAAGAEPVCG